MFRINDGQGFQMVFPNGYEISVQFGRSHMCSNHGRHVPKDKIGNYCCLNAEVAVFDPAGQVVDLGEEHYILGYQEPKDIIALINKFSSMEKVS